MNWLSLKLNGTKLSEVLKTPEGFHCGGCPKPHRCCDFTPFVPNFLVGEILQKGKRDQILDLEKDRLNPLGLFPGKNHSLCHFLDPNTKACQIWSSRPSECATYYCKERVSATSFFKEQSQWLFEVEMSMAQMAMVDLGFSDIEVADQIDAWNRGVESGSFVETSWPRWVVNPNDFYINCSNWFQKLDFLQFRCLLPESVREDFDKYVVRL